MEGENQPQERQPCPICGRKFLADRLQVHLRSCDKSGNYGRFGYDNKMFLDKLDAAMEKEEKSSTYKTSKKQGDDPNKAFLAKLDAEMEKEAKSSGYVPSKPKQKPKEDSRQNNYDNKAFLDRLDAEMKKEEEHPSYKNPKQRVKAPANQTDNQAFMEKLEKEIEKDSKNPYVPYKDIKKKMQKDQPQEDDYNKKFLERLDAEMKNEDKYKPSERPKKPSSKKVDLQKDFENKLNLEMEKDNNNNKGKNGGGKSNSNKQLMCYICHKMFNIPSYGSHVHMCENNWRRNNLGKDPSAMKPEKFDEFIQHVSNLKDEDIDKFNDDIFKNKDKMVFVPCDNCAKMIMQCKMEEHLKTCKPMFGKVKDTNSGMGAFNKGGYDLDKMIQDDQKNMAQVELIPCEKCGRKFAPDRLPVHIRGCKGKK